MNEKDFDTVATLAVAAQLATLLFQQITGKDVVDSIGGQQLSNDIIFQTALQTISANAKSGDK